MAIIKTLDGENIEVRLFESDKTHLKLSEKAHTAYMITKPLSIYEAFWQPPTEVYIGGGMSQYASYTYFIRGKEKMDNLTEAELNEFLEELSEEE